MRGFRTRREFWGAEFLFNENTRSGLPQKVFTLRGLPHRTSIDWSPPTRRFPPTGYTRGVFPERGAPLTVSYNVETARSFRVTNDVRPKELGRGRTRPFSQRGRPRFSPSDISSAWNFYRIRASRSHRTAGHGESITSRRRSLGSRWNSHLTVAWGERGWHSRKAALPATPYCTDSTAFLLAAGREGAA